MFCLVDWFFGGGDFCLFVFVCVCVYVVKM